MQIKHLPQHLQQLALKEAELHGRTNVTIETNLKDAFDWTESNQGYKFWYNMNSGNFNTEEP